MSFKPKFDRILVRKIAEKEEVKTDGGIFIPEIAKQNNHYEAEVVLVGEKVTICKSGDIVMLPKNSGCDIFVNGEQLELIREEQIDFVNSK